jgi:hypothetical protein
VTVNGVFYVALTAAQVSSLAERGRQQAATQLAAHVWISRPGPRARHRVRNAQSSRIKWRPDMAGVYVVVVKPNFPSNPLEKQLAKFPAIEQKSHRFLASSEYIRQNHPENAGSILLCTFALLDSSLIALAPPAAPDDPGACRDRPADSFIMTRTAFLSLLRFRR